MREKKFRGFCKHKDGKTIITINGEKKSGTWVYGVPNCYMEIQMPKLVIPKTVGQYTGRTDKNDKEIYEGDIVDICYKGIHYATATVKYDNNQFVLDTPMYVLSQSVWEDNDYSFEVIDNIHENPELMEGKNEQ